MNETGTAYLNRFAERYHMEVRSGKSYRRRIVGMDRPLPASAMHSVDIYHNFQTMEIPCYDITVPEDKFQDLVHTMQDLENSIHKSEYARTVLQRLREDERIRDDNPAVQLAYRKYLMLLELARK